MAVFTPSVMPGGSTLLGYEDDDCRFVFPEGGLFADFDHGSAGKSLLLVVERGECSFEVEIKRGQHTPKPAKDAALAFYDAVEPAFDEFDNVPPFSIRVGKVEGWRARKRFVDGFNAPLIIDRAFLQTSDALYTFTFTATPEEYVEGQWIFDLLLRTFHLLK